MRSLYSQTEIGLVAEVKSGERWKKDLVENCIDIEERERERERERKNILNRRLTKFWY